MSPSLEKVLTVLLKIVIVVLLGAGIYLFAQYFWPLLASMFATLIKLLLPLLIAYVIAVLVKPVIDLFEYKFHFARTPTTLVVLIVFLVIIGVFLYLLASNIIAELVDLTIMLSSLSNELNLNSAMDSLQRILQRLHLPSSYIQDAWNELWGGLDVVRGGISGLLAQVFNFIAALPEYLIVLVLMIIASFFFARDHEEIKTGMIALAERWLPDSWMAGARRIGIGLQKALHGYIKAILVLISITGFISLIGLSILGVEYAHILAIIMALLDLLPIIGPGAIFIPWAIWAFFTGSPAFGLGLLILYGIIIVIRQILEPKVVGDRIGLHPLTTLISIYVGYALFGIWGFILGPAVVITYKAFTEYS
ncbi:MAG: sporulation integral membrane protein YtvI [Syntrophaceticus sp.]|nr:sporulation integral membrane protein YtvI [Syntrophaceticus sp.]